MADTQARQPLTRILLKISGEALLGAADYGIDPAILKRIAGEIRDVLARDIQVAHRALDATAEAAADLRCAGDVPDQPSARRARLRFPEDAGKRDRRSITTGYAERRTRYEPALVRAGYACAG